jgi:hypothetical protein
MSICKNAEKSIGRSINYQIGNQHGEGYSERVVDLAISGAEGRINPLK